MVRLNRVNHDLTTRPQDNQDGDTLTATTTETMATIPKTLSSNLAEVASSMKQLGQCIQISVLHAVRCVIRNFNQSIYLIYL